MARSYQKNLKQQAYDKLQKMLHAGFGQSKHKDRQTGKDKDRIYSIKTYKTYKQHIDYFCDWLKVEHPEVRALRKAKPYVREWLQLRAADPSLSSATIRTEDQALAKYFSIGSDDPERFQAPRRTRAEITRSRKETTAGDRHFSEKNNAELINFCKCTGCRRTVLENLRGRDYWTRERVEARIRELEVKEMLSDKEKDFRRCAKEALRLFPDQSDFLWHLGDKGGKSRLSPIVGDGREAVIERLRRSEPYERVWKRVHSNMDVHGYRPDYVARVYEIYARPLDEIPYDRVHKGTGRLYQSEVYACRKDMKGRKFDRRAMRLASVAIGHGDKRDSVIASSYMYKL